MVSFAEDDWFRGLVCSMIALGCILCGYAVYYSLDQILKIFDAQNLCSIVLEFV